jgi:hypothetical protein
LRRIHLKDVDEPAIAGEGSGADIFPVHHRDQERTEGDLTDTELAGAFLVDLEPISELQLAILWV